MLKRKVIVAITGASGSIYAKSLIDNLVRLADQVEEIALVFSETGYKVWKYELEDALPSASLIRIMSNDNYFSPIASGSSNYDVMIVCPASMGSLGRIANGISNDLISRAADVILKEKRKLILVPREAPLNQIHIENMLKLSKAGSHLIPASPSFYSKPQTIKDLVETITERVLRAAGFEIEGYVWGD